MKRIIHKIAYLSIVSSCCIGCNDFLEIEPPRNQMVDESVFQTPETATGALLNIYSSFIGSTNASPYNLALYTGLSGDELTYFSSNAGLTQLYTNSLNQVDAFTNNLWSTAYNQIYRANAIVEGCSQSTTIGEDINNQITGEALFIRSYWYFYLVNLYGDIPLALSTNYLNNSELIRAKKLEVYKHIIEDLKRASMLLGEVYLEGNNVVPSSERVRPNKYTAIALLARVFLYTGNYHGADSASSVIIKKTELYNMTTLENAFSKNNPEAIWQVMRPEPNTNNRNTPEGYGFILQARPSNAFNSQDACSAISSSLLEAFEAGDKRKENWIGKFTDTQVTPNVDYYYSFKYKKKTSAVQVEYSTILRLPEQYLIRAEAKANLDKLDEAILDIDILRSRAGLSLTKDIMPNVSKEELLELIFRERRVELFAEQGHRWLDMIRLNKIDEIMNVVASQKNAEWDTRRKLWPIPFDDLQNAPSIKQNPGYDQ